MLLRSAGGADHGGFGVEEAGFGRGFGGLDAAFGELELFLVTEDAEEAVELAGGGIAFGSKFKGPLLDEEDGGFAEFDGLAVEEVEDVLDFEGHVGMIGEFVGECAVLVVADEFAAGDGDAEVDLEAAHDIQVFLVGVIKPEVELLSLFGGEGFDFGGEFEWFHGLGSFLLFRVVDVGSWILDFGSFWGWGNW